MESRQPLALDQLVFETVLEHATSRVPIAAPEDRVADVRAALVGVRFETAATVVIVRGEELAGTLAIEELLAAPAESTCGELMDRDPPVVTAGADQEVAAWKAARHGGVTLAIADERRRFLGVVAPSRLLGIVLAEHDEDMARLGGFMHGTQQARTASEETIARRIWHRLPWLLLGFLGALVSADIMNAFEATLDRRVILAFFVPGVVYLADAVGTQTETLVIRGLSVGISIRAIVVREVLTGSAVGLLLAALTVPIALLRWGEADVAVALALALLGACTTATLVAMAFPWLFHRMGKDPAFGSGPLATVVQDLLSLLIYLAVATAMVG